MLKGLFGPKLSDEMKAFHAQAQPWAASLGSKYELLEGGHIRIHGETAGYRWRLTVGPSSRKYFKNSEIKLGLSAHINSQVQGVLCTRRLAELIKHQVYGEATAVADTYALDDLPYEMTTVATQRERPLPESMRLHVACHSDATLLFEHYAEEFILALPGGLESLPLNTLLPWIVAVQSAGVVLRLGVPSLTLDHVKSTLRMQVALIKPLKQIEAIQTDGSSLPQDSLPSR